MTDRSRSVYASAPFKFIVDGEPLYIHADLVSLHSKPLDRMMNGRMAEAHRGFATLEDVNEGTFVRFIEWAHKGYYTAAGFSIDIEPSSISGSQSRDGVVSALQEDIPRLETAVVPTADPLWGFGQDLSQSLKKGKKGKKDIKSPWGNQGVFDDWGMKGGLKETFISRRYTVRQGVFEIPPPRPNQNPEENYTDVFLSHAQLYVFAEKYDVQPLKVLALEELHATLAIHTLYLERTGDIIALLRYIYRNTSQPF
ncbi:MAG: hypothetical protein Q9175_007385 [Cornicularia normoerica]